MTLKVISEEWRARDKVRGDAAPALAPCPLCHSPPEDHGWFVACSGANGRCILVAHHQDDTNEHVIRDQWPKN